jgi:hypothetical protein
MSAGIRIELGRATVELGAYESVDEHGAFAHYEPRDLVSATAAALLAVNTPQAVLWAHELYRIAAPTPRPTQTTGA